MTVVVARVRRSQALKAGHSFASCGQDESDDDDDVGLAFFNTSSGNQVVCGIPGEVRKALKKGTAALHPWSAPLGLWHLQAAADATVAQLPVVNPPADDDTSEAAEALRALEAAYAAGE